MILQILGIGAFGLGATVYDAFGGGVVSLDGGWRLGMSHFFQFVVNFNPFACIEVECDLQLGRLN